MTAEGENTNHLNDLCLDSVAMHLYPFRNAAGIPFQLQQIQANPLKNLG